MQNNKINIIHQNPLTLIADSRNARIHSAKQVTQIANSISSFGFNNPILIDDTKKVIAGHGRLLAAKELGLESVPTIVINHLSKAQVKAYMIADNKLAENAVWDEKLLAEHFLELSSLDLDFELEVTGFQMGEIDVMIEAISFDDIDLSDDEDDHSDGPVVSKTGDLWQLGKHRIYCGDSLESSSYDILMEDNRATMVFSDPPYNVRIDKHVCGLGKTKHKEFAMASGEMSKEEFTNFISSFMEQMKRFSIDGSIHFLCMDWRHMHEILGSGLKIYSELKNICVWVKDNGGMGSLYRSQHELVCVFKNGRNSHINNVELGKHGRYRTNVWHYTGSNSFARNNSKEGDLLSMHPTVKPVAMIKDAILDCSKLNDIILDSFLGSGSTLIASEKCSRVCYGIEIDPSYVDTAIRRWQSLTSKQAIHKVSGMSYNQMVKEGS